MGLLKKILKIAAGIIIVLAVAVPLIYKFVIVPKYIEPILVKVSTIMKDEDLQETMADIAADLTDSGVIDENTFKKYINSTSRYTKRPEASHKNNSKSPSGDSTDVTRNVISGSRSSLGMVSVNPIDDYSDTARVNEKYSQKFSSSNDDKLFIEGEKREEQSTEDFVLNDAVSNSKESELYNKIIKAMTIHERAVFFSVMSKADADKLIELYNASDKAAAKEYLHSVLDSGEYNEAVEIFFKYAPLLLEE